MPAAPTVRSHAWEQNCAPQETAAKLLVVPQTRTHVEVRLHTYLPPCSLFPIDSYP